MNMLILFVAAGLIFYALVHMGAVVIIQETAGTNRRWTGNKCTGKRKNRIYVVKEYDSTENSKQS